jgi:hypothetical protein
MMNMAISMGRRSLISGFLFVFSFTMSFGQDTVKTYIAYDVFKAFVNEHSVTIGHGFVPHHMVTFSLGYVYDNRNLRESFIGFSPLYGDHFSDIYVWRSCTRSRP